MELWDGYHRDGTLAGIDLVRGEPIPEGLYHLVCEILVRHRDGDYLLMKRSPAKPKWAGFCEATAGGSALKGEDALTCAKRELLEETGIATEYLEPIGEYVSNDTIYHNFLCITDCPKTAVTLQKGETVACRWVKEETFMVFANSDWMIPTQREHYAEYLARMGYIQR